MTRIQVRLLLLSMLCILLPASFALSQNAAGNYRAYFLEVADGERIQDTSLVGLSSFNDMLRERFGWSTVQVPLSYLMDGTIALHDPQAAGELIVIPGGSEALSDDEIEFLDEYVQAGGDLVIFASSLGRGEGLASLTTEDHMVSWMNTTFGLHVAHAVVLDDDHFLNASSNPISTDFADDHFITAGLNENGASVLFATTSFIEISDTPPANVQVTPLAYSSESAFAKSVTDYAASNFTADDDDPRGPFVLAAAAENQVTGARLVVFGTIGAPVNALYEEPTLSAFSNILVGTNALVWAIGFENQVALLPTPSPTIPAITVTPIEPGSLGDFRAYFLDVEGGASLEDTGNEGLSIFNNGLHAYFGWFTLQVSLSYLIDGTIPVNDSDANGEVIVIPGGTDDLSDDEIEFLDDYVRAGGSLVIFAGLGENDNGDVLATDSDMTDWLVDTFGVELSRKVVIDPMQAVGDVTYPYSNDFSDDHPITSGLEAAQGVIVFHLPHPIGAVDNLPRHITITPLAFSSDAAFTKPVDDVLDGDLEWSRGDQVGAFTLALAAENTATGARLVIFGSDDTAHNLYASAESYNLANQEMVARALAWAAHFDAYYVHAVAARTLQAPTPVSTP